jgi:hypothetical protein
VEYWYHPALPEFAVPDEDHLTTAALVALLLWPIVSLCIFAAVKTLSQALIWTVLGAQLLLPFGAVLKFPMIPQIDKITIVNFTALLGCLIFAKNRTARSPTKFGLVEVLLLSYIVGPIVTSQLNPDNILVGGRFIPGVGLYDALSAAEMALIIIIPFMLGRRFLRTAEDCYAILVILTVCGLLYSIPLLFEIRFSPQLHYWVYGYYPTDFIQAVREGSFRPMVFMGHGLLAAFFLMTSFLAATALWRSRVSVGQVPSSIASPILGVVLLLCKSMGALIYGAVGGLLVFFTRPKTQLRIATLLVTISLMYPLLRSFNLVPTTQIIDIAKSIDKERGESLEFRFLNEDGLLERAFERPFFGWGRYGRSRVYDVDTGKDISVTDGRWIIDIGQFGLIGFLAEFGLLAICVFRATSAFRLLQSAKDQIAFAALALIVSISIFELLPNSGLIPWTWLVSGALLGRSEALLARRSARSQNQMHPHDVLSNPVSPASTKVIHR